MKTLTTHLNEDFKISKNTKFSAIFDIKNIREMYDEILKIINQISDIIPDEYCACMELMIECDGLRLDNEILKVKSDFRYIGNFDVSRTPKHQIIDLSTIDRNFCNIIYFNDGYDEAKDIYDTNLYIAFEPQIVEFEKTIIPELKYVESHISVKPVKVQFYIGFTKFDRYIVSKETYPTYISFINNAYESIKTLNPSNVTFKFESDFDVLYFDYNKRHLNKIKEYILDEYNQLK